MKTEVKNTGDLNTGNWNTGDLNTGHQNTGHWNTGHWNTGDRNTGHWNTGDCNTGHCNTGDFNLVDYETGCFCTEARPLRFFDVETNMTMKEWRGSRAYELLLRGKLSPTQWVDADDMTDAEKADHPEYETTGGYLKTNDMSTVFQEWWDALLAEEKQIIRSIPNFDPGKFKKITGITV